MNLNPSFIIILVFLVGFMWWSSRTQKRRQQEQEDRLNSLTKGTEVVTIGGLYGVIDEVDRDKGTMVLDVDGVYLTFELRAFRNVVTPAATEETTEDAQTSVEAEESTETATEE